MTGVYGFLGEVENLKAKLVGILEGLNLAWEVGARNLLCYSNIPCLLSPLLDKRWNPCVGTPPSFETFKHYSLSRGLLGYALLFVKGTTVRTPYSSSGSSSARATSFSGRAASVDRSVALLADALRVMFDRGD